MSMILALNRRLRTNNPCLCPLATKHAQARMDIRISENEDGDMSTYFEQVKNDANFSKDKRLFR